jgi:hypothetical protein
MCQIQKRMRFCSTKGNAVASIAPSAGGNMASEKGDDKSPKTRTIEFDMFVRDLEPEKDDKIRGGGKTGDRQKPDDRTTEQPH